MLFPSGHSVPLLAGRLGQFLQNPVGVGSEVQILLEEVPAPVGEDFLGGALLLVLTEQPAGVARLVVVAVCETGGDDALLHRQSSAPQTKGDAGTSPGSDETGCGPRVTSGLHGHSLLLLDFVEETNTGGLEQQTRGLPHQRFVRQLFHGFLLLLLQRGVLG